MSEERTCDHCGYTIDEYEMLQVTKPDSGEPLVVDGKHVKIWFCSCHDCALPNVWYEYEEIDPKLPRKMVCCDCGSEDCEYRRYLVWDKEKQELTDEQNPDNVGSYCFSCDAVDRGLEWIGIDETWG